MIDREKPSAKTDSKIDDFAIGVQTDSPDSESTRAEFTNKSWRRWLPRFSLALLLVLLVGISLAFAIAANLRYEQQVISRLERQSKKVKVLYDFQLNNSGKFNGQKSRPGSPFLKRWFGEFVGAKVARLHVVGGDHQQSIVFLKQFSGLRQLRLENDTTVDNVSKLAGLEKLRTLSLLRIGALQDLDGLEQMDKLEHLVLNGCSNLSTLGSAELDCLESMAIVRCTSLKQTDDISGLKSLRQLEFFDSHELRTICDLSKLDRLENLTCSYCGKLQDLLFLQGHPTLEEVCLNQCKSLTSLRGLSSLPKLKRLKICFSPSLTSIKELKDLPSLEELDLSGCKQLETLDGLSAFPNLTKITLDGCDALSPTIREAVVNGRKQ